ncbi:MAG: preprotein translocase subunit SecY [Acidobacteria bacterium RIFCSPLOWO2_12_FULL_60_22]|nr:MAG: preprotein translocase subunit SecY [Acidobacteria bacterium RIFCSPLOWO2_12_FULL_60_22]
MKTIRNIFSIPELRNRILFTLGCLAVYRLGSHVPTPGINADLLQQFFEENQGTVFGFVDIFSGGNFRRLTIFALGIMPYITSSIILQLLTPVWPYLDRLHKEGEMGRQKITTYTRYLTVLLSLVQSFGIAMTLQQQAFQGTSFVVSPGPLFLLTTMITLTTGSVFIMWLGEQITQRGIGEGMSLMIFAGIVVGLPAAGAELYERVFVTNQWNFVQLLMLLGLMIVAVGFIVLVERGERRVNVQYATRMMGRKVFGGQSTHLPIRVNAGGVMPVIFASSILTFPQTIALMGRQSSETMQRIFQALAWGEPLYTLIYVVGIIFFAYFYVSIIFNPNDVADNVRKHGGFVPGIRPGKNTAEYLNSILTHLTLVGGAYLALVSLVPEWMISGIHLHHLPWAGGWIDEHFPRALLDGLGVSFYFGGTSLLIVVGVAMDTVSKIEAQLLMRHYEGFAPGVGRLRGRRG